MNPDLSQLRDIHLPEPVGWWPLAPGWWLLLGLVILVAAATMLLRRRRNQLRWRREAQAGVAAIRQSYAAGALDGQGVAARLSVLMRRVALSRFPRSEVASLSGEAWLTFLDSHLEGDGFADGVGRALIEAPYRKAGEVEAEPLLALCERWIARHDTQGEVGRV